MFVTQNHPCLPNKGKEFASGLTSSLVEKNLTSKSLQVHKKVNFRGIRGLGFQLNGAYGGYLCSTTLLFERTFCSTIFCLYSSRNRKYFIILLATVKCEILLVVNICKCIYIRGRYKSRTRSTRTASPGQINSDRLGSTRIE